MMQNSAALYLLPTGSGEYRLVPGNFAEAVLDAEARKTDVPEEKKSILPARPAEKMLKALEKWSRVIVYHDPELSETAARDIYRKLLEEEARKHRRWMIADGMLLPFSAILTLIPGPNLVMAYLAWRTAAHYKAQKRAKKAGQEISVQFRPLAAIGELAALQKRRFVLRRRQKIREAGEKLGIDRLDQWL